jgi:hypothetical protein
VEFLAYNIKHFYWTLFRPQGVAFVVHELEPLRGNVALFVFVAGYVLLALHAGTPTTRFAHPAFLLGLLGWMLSFIIVRFWLEFGLPAMLVWIALDLQDRVEARMRAHSPARLLLVLFAAGTLYLCMLRPHAETWRQNPAARADGVRRLYARAPESLPGQGGILYAATMRVFFTFFYLFPDAPWRYATGMEPGFMPAEDLRVYEAVNLTGAAEAYRPWIRKMRAEDRLVIKLPADGAIDRIFPAMNWVFVEPDYWIGRRRPAAEAPAPAHPAPAPEGVGP